MSTSPFPWSEGESFVFDASGQAICREYSNNLNWKDDRALIAAIPEMIESLERLTNASALYGVRQLVAGWNGEGRSEPFQHRHHDDLGAALPKTTCGAVYDLDDALQSARAVLKKVTK